MASSKLVTPFIRSASVGDLLAYAGSELYVVLVTAVNEWGTFQGVVVYSESKLTKVGTTSDSYAESYFRYFTGCIELSN